MNIKVRILDYTGKITTEFLYGCKKYVQPTKTRIFIYDRTDRRPEDFKDFKENHSETPGYNISGLRKRNGDLVFSVSTTKEFMIEIEEAP